jgi:hypothetical protein
VLSETNDRATRAVAETALVVATDPDAQLDGGGIVGIIVRGRASFFTGTITMGRGTGWRTVGYLGGDVSGLGVAEEGVKILGINIRGAHVINIIREGLAVYNLKPDIELVAHEILEADAVGDIHLGQAVHLPVRMIGHAFTFRAQRAKIHPHFVAGRISVHRLGIEMEYAYTDECIRTNLVKKIGRILFKKYRRVDFSSGIAFHNRRAERQVAIATGFLVTTFTLDDAVSSFQSTYAERQAEIDELIGRHREEHALHQAGHLNVVVFDKGLAFAKRATQVTQEVAGAYVQAEFIFHLSLAELDHGGRQEENGKNTDKGFRYRTFHTSGFGFQLVRTG